MLLADLKSMAGGMGVSGAGSMKKAQLVEAIKAAQAGASAAPASTSAPKVTRTVRTPKAAPSTDAAPKAAEPEPESKADIKADAPEAKTEPKTEPKTEGRSDARSESDPTTEPTNRQRTRNRQAGQQGNQQTGQQEKRQDQKQDQKQGSQADRSGERPAEKQGNQQANQQGQNRNQQGGQQQGGQQQGGQQANQQQGQQGQQQLDDFDDDGEGGSRRNRRRRGRDRERQANRVPGGRNEPDTTVLEDDVLVPAAGILDVLDNYAFVRTSGYLPGTDDVYLSLSMVRKFGLRRGDAVVGQVRQPREGERKEKFNPMVRIDSVNGTDPEAARERLDFETFTPVHPTERLRLETDAANLTGRVIDIAAPIGKGQRGLIVAPPKSGRTMLLQSVAQSISRNNPEVHLMVVLLDARPEEVTDFQRAVKGEVIASTFDRAASDHTMLAELAIERAKRLVELGHDVAVLLDSVTSLARAYNVSAPATGRTLAGGVDAGGRPPAQAALRRGPQRRGRRLAHHLGDGRRRDRVGHRRGDLRGVRRHRQHGAAAPARARRVPHLPGRRHRRLGHPPGGAAVQRAGGRDRPVAASTDVLGADRVRGDRARADPQGPEQHRVPDQAAKAWLRPR